MTLKALRIDPDLSPELADAVRRVEPMLERVLGNGAGRAEVVWEPGVHEVDGDPAVRLTITDTGVSRSDEFFDWEFREDLHVRRRLREVWHAVLDERIRLQQREVHASLAEAGEV